MSNYWIGSIVDYNQSVADEVKLDEAVKKHSPIYSPDGKEVLVKGIGDMAIEDVKSYQEENWVYTDDVV